MNAVQLVKNEFDVLNGRLSVISNRDFGLFVDARRDLSANLTFLESQLEDVLESENDAKFLLVYPSWPFEDRLKLWPENFKPGSVKPLHLRENEPEASAISRLNIAVNGSQIQICLRGLRASSNSFVSEVQSLLKCRENEGSLSFCVPNVFASYFDRTQKLHFVEFIGLQSDSPDFEELFSLEAVKSELMRIGVCPGDIEYDQFVSSPDFQKPVLLDLEFCSLNGLAEKNI